MKTPPRTERDVLAHRLVTGIVLIAVLLVLLWLDASLGPIALGSWMLPPGLLLAGLGAVVVALGAGELVRVADAAGIRTDGRLTAAATVLTMLATWLSAAVPPEAATMLPVTALALILVASLVRFSAGRRVEDAFSSTAVVLLISIYLGALSGFLLLLGGLPTVWMIGAVALVVKSCDMGAYFTGRALGRRKLIPWLSPGKTVEGLLGGIGASMLTASVLNLAAASPFAWWWVLIMGGILAWALLVDRVGFIPATVILVLACASVEIGSTWRSSLLLAGGLCATGYAIFIRGLGIPLSPFGG